MLRRTLPVSAGLHALALGVALWVLPAPAPAPEQEVPAACVALVASEALPEERTDAEPDLLPLAVLEHTPRNLPADWLPATPAPDEETLAPLDDEEPVRPTDGFEELPLSAVRVRQRPAPHEPPPYPRPSPAPPPRARAPTPRTTPTHASRGATPPRATPLRVLHRPSVARYYPMQARRLGMQGTVLLVLVIDARGRVIRTTLARSSGHRLLDEAAQALAQAYRFSVGVGLRRTRLPVSFRMTM